MTGPIKPNDVDSLKLNNIPSEVFDAFNELIAENIRAHRAVVSQADVVARILSKLPTNSRADVYAKGWLDIESLYTAAGWNVSYDTPGYNETGTAYYTFAKRG